MAAPLRHGRTGCVRRTGNPTGCQVEATGDQPLPAARGSRLPMTSWAGRSASWAGRSATPDLAQPCLPPCRTWAAAARCPVAACLSKPPPRPHLRRWSANPPKSCRRSGTVVAYAQRPRAWTNPAGLSRTTLGPTRRWPDLASDARPRATTLPRATPLPTRHPRTTPRPSPAATKRRPAAKTCRGLGGRRRPVWSGGDAAQRVRTCTRELVSAAAPLRIHPAHLKAACRPRLPTTLL